MKRWLLPVMAALMVFVLAGCRKTEQPPAQPDEPPASEIEKEPEQTPDEPLVFKELTVELSRGSLSTAELMDVVKQLPEQLRQALAQQDVTVEKIRLSIGASTDATAEAVLSGSVDVAFLPAQAAAKTGLNPLLVFGPASPACPEKAWEGIPEQAQSGVGEEMLICAAPTKLGENLTERESLTWAELSHARWGVPGDSTAAPVMAVECWLRQHWDGLGLASLPQVTAYENYEDLVRAAAAGEVDIAVLPQRVRADWAQAWSLSASRTDAQGAHGMGRREEIWQELEVLAVTERYYTAAAVAAEDVPQLQDARFAPALAAAVEALQRSGCMAFGMDGGAVAAEDALSFMARWE